MFRETTRQAPLFGADSHLTESVRRRLDNSWARPFLEHIFPILLEVEADFADLYSSPTGQPVWSVGRKLGICILQELFDLDDQRALDQLSFDVRWQYALGFGVDEDPYLSRRSLVEFRARLLKVDPTMERLTKLFDRISNEALKSLGIDASTQRADSTLIQSNIRDRGRVDLIATTLRHFLSQLKKDAPEHFDHLPEEIRSWAGPKDGRGWFTNPRGQTSNRQALETLGDWLYEVVQRFKDQKLIKGWKSFEYVVRVLHEHFEVMPDPDPPSGGYKPSREVAFEVRKHAVSQQEHGGTLQSPHDPDAAKGHKGVGYVAHIVETCGNKGVPEILTGFLVLPANQADQDKAKELIAAQERNQNEIKRLFVDGGYTTPVALEAANEDGIELYGPMTPPPRSNDYLGRDEFQWTEDGQIAACPAGHHPIDHRSRVWEDGQRYPHAFFDRATCQSCPFRDQCAVRIKNKEAYLPLVPRLRLRDEELARQKDEQWWEAYSIRSGVEATISELKRAHGMRKLRVRGLPRVTMAIALKATACNVKRWMRAA